MRFYQGLCALISFGTNPHRPSLIREDVNGPASLKTAESHRVTKTRYWVGQIASFSGFFLIHSILFTHRATDCSSAEPREIGYAERCCPYSPKRRPHHQQIVKRGGSTSNTIGLQQTRPGRNRESVLATLISTIPPCS